LYFVTHYEELQLSLNLDTEPLKSLIISLWDKGWLRCYLGVDKELDGDTVDFENQFNKYHYLASKEGLMAHNSR
jgi:hypothetical protein